MSAFKIGDVVVLKSGDPAMTIAKELTFGWYQVCWFSDNSNKPLWDDFDGAMLKEYKEESFDIEYE